MRRFLFGSLLLFCLMVQAESKFKLGKGQLTVTNVARNAVRIQYAEGTIVDSLPDWLYVKHGEVSQGDVKVTVKMVRSVLRTKLDVRFFGLRSTNGIMGRQHSSSTRRRMSTSTDWDSSRTVTAMCGACLVD